MLVAFVEDARSVTRRPVPAPSVPLAAILAGDSPGRRAACW